APTWITRGLLLRTRSGRRKSGVSGATWFSVVRPDVLTRSTVFTEPGTYCGWLKALKKSARNWIDLDSPNRKFLNSEMSKLLIHGSANVLRPMLDSAPFPVWMSRAFELTAR